MPSKISALASAIASTEAKYPRCTGSTVVMTATSGCTIGLSAAISPAWFMPSSNTPNAVSRGMRASDSGTPHWLLRLPAEAVVRPWRSKARRSASLVPVLPTLPVTATMAADVRARAARPSASSATCVSATSTSGASTARPWGWRLTTAAAAPALSAAATKSWPSKWGPLSATNRSPGATVRLSIDTPRAIQSRVLRAAVAAAASAAVHEARS